MDAQEKFGYWLEQAQYDLDTADAMFTSKRWIYVIFMCQQAIEKLVKGLYGLYLDFDSIPKVHRIAHIAEGFEDKLSQPISADAYALFDLLSSYYLNNRYPDYSDKLAKQTDQRKARETLDKTKEVFAWLLTLKP
jgi:HEPN domain-containing protein